MSRVDSIRAKIREEEAQRVRLEAALVYHEEKLQATMKELGVAEGQTLDETERLLREEHNRLEEQIKQLTEELERTYARFEQSKRESIAGSG